MQRSVQASPAVQEFVRDLRGEDVDAVWRDVRSASPVAYPAPSLPPREGPPRASGLFLAGLLLGASLALGARALLRRSRYLRPSGNSSSR